MSNRYDRPASSYNLETDECAGQLTQSARDSHSPCVAFIIGQVLAGKYADESVGRNPLPREDAYLSMSELHTFPE